MIFSCQFGCQHFIKAMRHTIKSVCTGEEKSLIPLHYLAASQPSVFSTRNLQRLLRSWTCAGNNCRSVRRRSRSWRQNVTTHGWADKGGTNHVLKSTSYQMQLSVCPHPISLCDTFKSYCRCPKLQIVANPTHMLTPLGLGKRSYYQTSLSVCFKNTADHIWFWEWPMKGDIFGELEDKLSYQVREQELFQGRSCVPSSLSMVEDNKHEENVCMEWLPIGKGWKERLETTGSIIIFFWIFSICR